MVTTASGDSQWQAPRHNEMVSSGDWITPRLDGLKILREAGAAVLGDGGALLGRGIEQLEIAPLDGGPRLRLPAADLCLAGPAL